jgi:hypothetical protein
MDSTDPGTPAANPRTTGGEDFDHTVPGAVGQSPADDLAAARGVVLLVADVGMLVGEQHPAVAGNQVR